jgi:hypothetical protein
MRACGVCRVSSVRPNKTKLLTGQPPQAIAKIDARTGGSG